MKPSSIATRLFISAAFWSLLVLAVAGVVLSAIYARQSENAFDERLHVYTLEIIADLTSLRPSDRSNIGQLGEPAFNDLYSGWYWQVVRVGGGDPVIAASRSLYGVRLASPAVKAQTSRVSSYIAGPDERQLRVVERRVDLGDEGLFVVSVANPVEELKADIASFRLALALTFAGLAAALILTTFFQVRFGLRPLSNLRTAVTAVREGRSERIAGAYPSDLAPLAGELNLLIDANRDILDRARTQVGNLAHALKTPISVLVNEAEASGGPLAEKVAEQTNAMRHHVDYYLNRARAAALAGALGRSTEVKPVVEGLVRVFTKMSRERGLDIAATLPGELKFRGERQDLEEMVGNLIDNACKWAAARVEVAAAAEPDGLAFTLTIDNDGPSLTDDERKAALKRGIRLDETKPGSGLGLSIVGDLAAMYGGRLELADSPLGGVRSLLRLPALPPAGQAP